MTVAARAMAERKTVRKLKVIHEDTSADAYYEAY